MLKTLESIKTFVDNTCYVLPKMLTSVETAKPMKSNTLESARLKPMGPELNTLESVGLKPMGSGPNALEPMGLMLIETSSVFKLVKPKPMGIPVTAELRPNTLESVQSVKSAELKPAKLKLPKLKTVKSVGLDPANQ